ncbi:hypothetical protein OBBRIDRAFT_740243 [Obba rivulosa]|uniref:Uncharacterized protein n=1 Tax=Obba rivulosa TaxID=1052685 RepID=A0A8E2AIN5_9APHY|nr:hypothetical protein OBBRIDRAFT_740243 [Obba rivulosa]
MHDRDTADVPRGGAAGAGRLVLGHVDDGSMNEHLDLDHPLAEDVDLTRGHVEIQVPSVTPGDDYIVVLFGDSGNRSPRFTIAA